MSAKARKQLEGELRDEWRKIRAEDHIQQLQAAVKRYDQRFRHAIHLVVTSLRVNRQPDALRWMDEAIREEKAVQKTLQEMQRLEAQVQHHLRREIHDEKRQVHAAKRAAHSA
jgi:hypothetical protein